MLQNRYALNKIFNRIDTLRVESTPKWGTMNVHQMLTHCELHIKMTTGYIQCKDVSIFIVRDIAKYFILHLRFFNMKNVPTVNEINMIQNQYPITDDIDTLKQRLKKVISELADSDDLQPSSFHHPIFGKMNKSQCCRINYIHLHHHLCQFGL